MRSRTSTAGCTPTSSTPGCPTRRAERSPAARTARPDSGDPVAQPSCTGCVQQFCYIDDIESWSTNELTINWNAALSWIGSFLADVGRESR